MKMKMLSCLVWSASCGVAVAQTSINPPAQPTERFDTAQPEQFQSNPVAAPQSNNDDNQTRHISSQELRKEPELLQRALDSAILTRNDDALKLLSPIYDELENKDEILSQYAKARIAQSDGKMQQAISLYENIVEKQPHAAPVRFDLVQTLLQDSRYADAQKHIDTLQENESLPNEINAVLNHHKSFLQQQRKWQFSGSLNYLHENNINNAPSQTELKTETGTWRFSPPEKARGVSYELSADKKIPIKSNWFAHAGGYVYGKHYHQKHQYNDLSLGVQAGLSHRNSKREWRVLPILEKRWFGGKSYSKQYGVRVQHNRPINNKWQSFTNVRAAYTKHQHRAFLDGSSFSFSQTFQYQANKHNFVLLGVDFLQENAKDKSSASFRNAARVGWVNRWQGLETSAHLMASNRRYKGADWFLNERRKDHEYTATLKMAHNKIQWRGVMPKFVVRWNKQNSNHLLYRYRKQQVFIELDKSFG